MTLGAFGVIALLNSSGKTVERVDDLAGLGRSHPVLALAMSVFLFSLIGLPLTAGFIGKFMLFFGAVAVIDQQRVFGVLALIGAINAAIGAYYYLRIVGVMYLRGAIQPLGPTRSLAGAIAVGLCVLMTVWFGVAPNALQRVTQAAASQVVWPR
jgi:NADH-quinone oxidoreductase subunit N